MSGFYAIAGISKQAVWKHRKMQCQHTDTIEQAVQILGKVRKNHKRMGSRKIYAMHKEDLPIGRDIFEQIAFANGFKLKKKRNTQKTTWSQKVEIFPNLIEGREVTGINEVWQSDIFYLRVENKDYYGVTIEDIYSRKLLALHLSESLRAEENIKALKTALHMRKGHDLANCIFHSDRGSQYISTAHKNMLKSYKMQLSMCVMPQQNAYVERLQGTLKHEYFYEHKLTQQNLQQLAAKIQKWYNNERPHKNLNMITPDAFEVQVQKMLPHQRPKMLIHSGYSHLSTNGAFINKKEKSSKKEKIL
jgi:transposase InsO family protein